MTSTSVQAQPVTTWTIDPLTATSNSPSAT